MTSRLLIAYSDESYLEIYQSFFWDHGYEVEIVANVDECIATLPEFDPDVLMIEQELVGGGGDLVIVRLRNLSCGKHCYFAVDQKGIVRTQSFGHRSNLCTRTEARNLSTLLEAVRSAGRRRKRLVNAFALIPIAVS